MMTSARSLSVLVLLGLWAAGTSTVGQRGASNCETSFELLSVVRQQLQRRLCYMLDGGPSFARMPLTVEARSWIRDAEQFLEICSHSERTIEVRFALGGLYYRCNHLDRAVSLLDELVRLRPEHDLAEHAANLVLDSLNIQQDHASLREAVDRYAATPGLMRRRSFRELIAKLQPALLFKRADHLFRDARAPGELRATAAAYLAVADGHPTWHHADAALFNAAICLENAGDRDAAIRLYRSLLRAYPASELADHTRRVLGIPPIPSDK